MYYAKDSVTHPDHVNLRRLTGPRSAVQKIRWALLATCRGRDDGRAPRSERVITDSSQGVQSHSCRLFRIVAYAAEFREVGRLR
jgi:hypothetical protein